MKGRVCRVKQSFRDKLAPLEGWLDRLGTVRSSMVMTFITMLALLGVHVILKTLEGEPVTN